MKKMVVYFILLLFLTASASGKVPLWEIVNVDNQPYKNVILHKLSDDSLYVKAYGKTFSIPVDSLRYMQSEKSSGSYAVPGFFLGMIGGGVLGNLLTGNSGGKNIFSDLGKFTGTGLGIAVGGVVGMAMGASSNNPEYYNLRKRTHEQKLSLLMKLLTQTKKRLNHLDKSRHE